LVCPLFVFIMQNIQEFNKKLQRDFPRYRARFSPHTQTIKIEVKMGTGYWDVNPALFKANPDLMVQVKDGYVEWAEITTGDRARCVNCTNTVKVPVREFKEVKCNWCETAQPARAYFDLNDDLLYYMNKISRSSFNPQHHKSNNDNQFDIRMDKAFDNAMYNARENEWKVNNGVRVSVPSNFRKVI
jgi:hypothetical protein